MARLRAGGQAEEGLKKGPWTQEEDQKLIAFIQEHGHGNWRAVPKRSGLQRCGKSCRLRWTNYLRPDIKRGQFTEGEKQKIIELHALVGNKWAFIASQLPSRTDNEIKNYWNTVLRKRQQPATATTLAAAAPAVECNTQKQYMPDSCYNSYQCCAPRPTGALQATNHLAQWGSARLQAEARLVAPAISTGLFSARGPPILTTAPAGTAAKLISSTPTPAAGTPIFTPSDSRTPTTSCILISPSFPSNPMPSILNLAALPPPLPASSTTSSNYLHTDLLPPALVDQHSADPLFRDLLSLCDANLRSRPPQSPQRPSITPNYPYLISSSQSSFRPVAAITLGANGQLSWKTQELVFKEPNVVSVPPSEQKRHKSSDQLGMPLDHHLEARRNPRIDMTVEATSTAMNLNRMLSLSSSCSWHELPFEMDTGCSFEVMSSNLSECEPKSSQECHSQCEKASSLMINSESRCNIEGSKAHVIGTHMKRVLAHESNLMPFHTLDEEVIGMDHMDVEILASIMG